MKLPHSIRSAVVPILLLLAVNGLLIAREPSALRMQKGKAGLMGSPTSEVKAMPMIISHGSAAGKYQAFPDICRLQNGDLVAVFYAGYGHVSLPKPPDWPNGGRICMVRSRDEGHTWSAPVIIYDDPDDNRDPSIAQMPDGSVICNFFSLHPTATKSPPWQGAGVKLIRSRDGGRTWSREAQALIGPGEDWYCSSPVRALADGTWLLGIYYFSDGEAYGGVLRSTDQGRTWGSPIPIGKGQNIPLDAETDVIVLKDGRVFAALRSSKAGVNMHYATSADGGKTWTPAQDIGFRGEAPYLYRMRDGALLLSHRVPDTSLHISRDEGRTWQGPFEIDNVIGAYPSCVELKDGTVLFVYYSEGQGSAVRARRFRVTATGIEPLPL